MSAEHKIDITKWNGPMTVVGYPDFSASRYMSEPKIKTETPVVTEKTPIKHTVRSPKNNI